MLNTFYDCYQVLSKVYMQDAYISQALNNTAIEPLKRREITKICYGVLDRDIEFSYYINLLAAKPPKSPIRILVKISMYVINYLQKPPHAVINNTVELAKKLGKSGAAGFINAILRNFIMQKFSFPDDRFEYMSVKYSYPLFAVRMLDEYYGTELCEKIISNEKEHSFARFDNSIDGENYLLKNNIEFEKTPFKNLFDVKKLKINEDFYNGVFTFQSIGSVAICQAVPKSAKILDACAAPGGKSVLLAEKANEVTALEIHPHRLELINSYVSRMRKNNITAILSDASIFEERFCAQFDSVLCDVPCSGFGTIKENPDIKLKKTEANIFNLAQTQSAILQNCASYVKSGGFLVYSTCSILQQENDCIIEKFLRENENYKIDFFDTELDGIRTSFGIQYLPHMSFGAGFYVARLKKI